MSLANSRGRRARRLAPLALVLGSAAASGPSLAEQLDPVVVTATRTPLRVGDAVAEVTVIDRTMLERATGRTLVEVLAQQPGLQFTSNGGLGKTSSVFIRGLEARHTLLLVDGVRVSAETVGSPSLDNLPLEIVDRIEIVRGPMSSLYGNNAMGGVIQVFTRRGRPGLHPNASVVGGTNRYGQASGGIAFGEGAFDAAVQLQHTQNRGFSATNEHVPFGMYNPDDDGFRQNGGSVRLGWQVVPDWRLEGLAVESDGETGYDDGPGVDARAALRNSLQSIQLQGRVTADWRTRLSAARSFDEYDTLSSASPWATLGPVTTTQKQYAWEISDEDRKFLQAGRNVLAIQATPTEGKRALLLQAALDEIRPSGAVLPLRAVVCDQCSSLPEQMPACVHACPHDAAMRVDAWTGFPTR